jgi:hypothetical protein
MKTIFALVVVVAILMLGAVAAEDFATWQVRSVPIVIHYRRPLFVLNFRPSLATGRQYI